MNLFHADNSWTLFLDRDGVINVRKMGGYILDTSEFVFLPGAAEAIAFFSTVFQHVIVVTNQQGIGKGLMTERNLFDIHAYMHESVERAGGKISASYFAPELKDAQSAMRKPAPGMALKAQGDFPEIDFSRSIMVGDTDSDIKFGKNIGMKTVRILTEEPVGIEADATFSSLQELMEIWKK